VVGNQYWPSFRYCERAIRKDAFQGREVNTVEPNDQGVARGSAKAYFNANVVLDAVEEAISA
jgi:hypothetical protein